MSTTRITVKPEIEPVTLEEMKNYLRIYDDISAEDVDVSQVIQAARETIEQRMALACITQTVTQTGKTNCNGHIRLSRYPAQEIVSVVDENGDAITIDASLLTPTSQRLKTGVYDKNLTITYIAGFGDSTSDVPANIKQTIKAYAGFLFDNRGNDVDIPLYIQHLINGLSWGGEV